MSKESDEIDKEPSSIQGNGEVENFSKNRREFSKLKYELSDDDLKSPGVQKMLLAEIDRLERECTKLSEIRENYSVLSAENVRLSERQKQYLSSEILFGFALTIGSALFSLSFSLEKDRTYIIIVGALLIVGGIIAKVIRK